VAEPVPHVTEMTVNIRDPATGQQLMFVYNHETQMVGMKADLRGDGNFVLIAEMSKVEFRSWAANLANWATLLQGI
jgi:hypothetical protein